MASGKQFKTQTNIETFITMVLLGKSAGEIIAEIGFSRQTYYDWLNDVEIIKELDKRRHELYTEGQAFIKGRYKKYLENIDKACNDMSDKRTFLSANIYMIDKMDGKATSKLDVTMNETDTIEDTKQLIEKYKQRKLEQQQHDNEEDNE